MTTPTVETRSSGLECGEPLRGWLSTAVELGASDLHVVCGYPPVLRIHGSLDPIGSEPLEGDPTAELLVRLCPEALREKFLADQNLDFSFELEIEGRSCRFRANLFFSGGI